MQHTPTIRKQPADRVPYGSDISTHGGYVWCAYDGERLVCMGATAKEARELYWRARTGAYGRSPVRLPSELEEPARRWKK